MTSKFVHLHVHSHYSLLDGLAKVPQLIDEVQRQGMDALALTDHGVMYGAVEFYLACQKANIKPIIGVEAYLAPNGLANKRAGIDRKQNHLVLLAKNYQGFQNLLRMTSEAHLKGFYYKPRIDRELLEKHSDGIIAFSSCVQGEIPQAIIGNDMKKAEKLVGEYIKLFGEENFYLELQDHPNIDIQDIANQGVAKLAKKFGLPLLATNDVHYARKEDAESQDVLVAIQTKRTVNDPDRLSMTHSDFSLRTEKDMSDAFKEFPDAISNTKLLSERVNLEIPIGKSRLPYYEVPKGTTSHEHLTKLVHEGVNDRFGVELDPKGKVKASQLSDEETEKVRERIEYELGIIEKTGFPSYFLIVQDLVNWSKERGIVVGPGRGSAAGSLVSYVLRITNVDPLKYDLLFERFLNPERISMPDIDLDFTDIRRDEVLKYVAEKYGRDKVAQIITFGTMAARAAIRDVTRALGYEYSLSDRLAKLIPFQENLTQAMDSSLELRQAYDTDPKARRIIDLAKKLEGVARHASTHACGVVITEKSLTNYTPLQFGTTGEESVVTQFEMTTVEKLGLLKMDFLGLRNLTIIEETLRIIKKRHGEDIDIDKIPMDDKDTFKLLKKGNAVGIFQLESEGMRGWLKELKPTEFNDITAMVALYRPGPMELIPNYVARKHMAAFVDLFSTWGHASSRYFEEKNAKGQAAFSELMSAIFEAASQLVAHGCLDGVLIGFGKEGEEMEYQRAVNMLAQSVFNADLSMDRNELAAMKFLLGTGCRVGQDGDALLRGSHLLQTIRTLYHVYLTTESSPNKTTARAALQQLTTSVFSRVARPTDEDDEELQRTKDNFPSENHRDAFLVLRSICKLSMRTVPGTADGGSTSFLSSHVGLQSSGSNDTWGDEKHVDTPAASPARNGLDGSARSAGPDHHAQLLYTSAVHPALESKLLALELILYVLQHTDFNKSFVAKSGPQLQAAIRNYLCVSLLKNCTSGNTRVVNLSLRIFVPLVRYFRTILKSEIEAFVTNVFFVILDSKNSPAEHKSIVVKTFDEICSDPTTLAEIFLNYDCDLSAVDLFHRIVNTLSTVSRTGIHEPKSSSIFMGSQSVARMEKQRIGNRELRLVAMKALRQVLASLHASIVEPMSFGNSKEEDVESLPHDADVSLDGEPSGDDASGDNGKQSLVEIYGSKKKRRAEEAEIILRFNRKPSAGIAYAVKCKHLDGSNPAEVAGYLLKNKDVFDKTQIGEYLGREAEYQSGFSIKVLHEYVRLMDFNGLLFDEAIRFFLSGFRLPGEAQKVRA